MVVPFGFSIGDFFGAAGVLSQVVKALRKHGGAEDNYRAVCVEVELFGNILKEVESLTANDANKNHIEAILEHATCCKVELERFLEKLSKYDASLGENVERITWSERARGNARKAKWALFMHERVSEVRDAIRRAGDGISMRLLLVNFDSTARLEQGANDTLQVLDSLSASQRNGIEEVQTTLLPAIREAIELRDEALLDLRNLFEDGLNGILQELRSHGEDTVITSQNSVVDVRHENERVGEQWVELHHKLTLCIRLNDLPNDLESQKVMIAQRLLSRGDIKILRHNIINPEDLRIEGRLEELVNRAELAFPALNRSYHSPIDLASFHNYLGRVASEGIHKILVGLDVFVNLPGGVVRVAGAKLEVLTLLLTNSADTLRLGLAGFVDLPGVLMRVTISKVEPIALLLSKANKFLQSVMLTKRRLEHATMVLESISHSLQRNSSLKYTWYQEPIRFEDALGREFPIPFEYSNNSEFLKAVISSAFRGLPGQDAVAADQFKIFDRGTGNLITSKQSESTARPGSRFVMALEAWVSHDKHSSCPRCCNMLERPLVGQNGLLMCSSCGLNIYGQIEGRMAFAASTAGDNAETYARNVYLVCPALFSDPTSPKGALPGKVLGDIRAIIVNTGEQMKEGEVD